MTMQEIRNILQTAEYSFLREEECLGKNIILLGMGGSYSYGTNKENSDIDVRGVALNSKREILTNRNFEQFVDVPTDTTIYAFNKIITLLTSCNPNTIELLGLKPEHYLYVAPIGQELLDQRKLFLSQKAIHSFGGYANQQLRRLCNKSNRVVSQSEQEQHIFNTIKNAMHEIKTAYADFTDGEIRLYIDKAVQEGYDTEIFMDVNLKHYPLRDYKAVWSEMQSIVKSYSKVGMRNSKAIEHNKLGKHMMHLMRLYMMCLDILQSEEIVTYREKEHDLLMDIRNGKYLDDNKQPTHDFYELLNEYEKRFEYAKVNTSLPEEPDYGAIDEFVASVNERVVKETV